MRLLEKKAKGKRESGTQNVSFPNLRVLISVFPLCLPSANVLQASSSRQDAGQSSDTTTTEPEAAPVATSATRETPTTSPAVKPDSSPETIRPASRVQDQPLPPPLGSIDRIPQPVPRDPSAFSLSGFRTQPLALACKMSQLCENEYPITDCDIL